ncbi:MFS family permease [Pseudonocardia eucalypti]|nr:MFS family permease [Pseudonocardia eucalypti]
MSTRGVTARVSVRGELLGPKRRATTVGVLLIILMVAFEAMGVNTAMPRLVVDLGALTLYAWPFVAFMAAAVFGTVMAGWWCDRSGPRVPLLVAPALFGAGLVTAALAHGMPQLLGGRVLQGLGAGTVTVSMYVLIALIYPERVRPAMFGLMSSAWVLPSLIGPPISGIVTERWSWRWVFLGLVPIVVMAFVLVVPAVRRLGEPERGIPPAGGPAEIMPGGPAEVGPGGPAEIGPRGSAEIVPGGLAEAAPGDTPTRDAGARGRGVVLAALAAAVGVSALSYAGERKDVFALVIAAGAILLLVPALRRLLPGGVFAARQGVPTLVAARGLCAALFGAANSFLPLMLTSSHRWSLAAAGIPLAVGSLGWSAASFWQGRHPDLPRARLLRVGFGLLTVSVLGLQLVAQPWGAAWLSFLAWAIAGAGMGLCFPSVNFLLLRQSERPEVGFNTSAAQVSEQLGTAAMIGVGGALLALFGVPTLAMPVLLGLLTLLGVTGMLIAGRAATS